MKITPIKAIIGFFSLAVLVQLAFFLPADAQMSLQSLWKLQSGILQPNNASWPVSIGDLTIGSISEGDMTVSNNLTVTGTTTLATTTASMINRIVYVDGNNYQASGIGIQNAINDQNSLGGGVVEVNDDGIYLITTKLTIPSNITLRCAGYGVHLKLDDSVDTIAIQNSDTSGGNSNIHIENCRIDGNDANQTSQVDLINFTNVTDSTIQNNWVENAKWAHITLESSDRNTIKNNKVTGGNGHGILLSNNSEYNDVIGNKVYNIGSDGGINFGSGSVYGYGIYVYNGSRYNTVLDNDVLDVNGHGIALSTSNASTTDNYIIGNDVFRAGLINTSKSHHGISLLSVEGNFVTNNKVASSSVYGISLDEAYENQIAHNDVYESQQHGIYLRDSDKNDVDSNWSYNNGQATSNTYSGIFLAHTASGHTKYNDFTSNYTFDNQSSATQKHGIRETNTTAAPNQEANYNTYYLNRFGGNIDTDLVESGANNEIGLNFDHSTSLEVSNDVILGADLTVNATSTFEKGLDINIDSGEDAIGIDIVNAGTQSGAYFQQNGTLAASQRLLYLRGNSVMSDAVGGQALEYIYTNQAHTATGLNGVNLYVHNDHASATNNNIVSRQDGTGDALLLDYNGSPASGKSVINIDSEQTSGYLFKGNVGGSDVFTVDYAGNSTTTGISTLATTTISQLNGTIYVDGVHYPQTGAGLNNAISDCSSMAGATSTQCMVVVSKGLYELIAETTVLPKNNIYVRCEEGAVLQRDSASSLPYFRHTDDINGLINFTLENCTFRNGKSWYSRGNVASSTFMFNEFITDGQSGFPVFFDAFAPNPGLVIKNNVFDGNSGGSDMLGSGELHYGEISFNVFRNGDGQGIGTADTDYARIIGNRFENVGNCIGFESGATATSTGNIVSNNVCYNSGNIKLGSTASNDVSENSIVSNNQILFGGGLQFGTSIGDRIEGNNIYASQNQGIYGLFHRSQIENNTLYDTNWGNGAITVDGGSKTNGGINLLNDDDLASPTDVVIKNNYLIRTSNGYTLPDGTPEAGNTGSINIDSSYADVVVENNTLENVFGGGIYSAPSDTFIMNVSSDKLAIGTTTADALLHLYPNTDAQIGFVIQGRNTQTGNLLELWDDSDVNVFSIDASGNATTTGKHIVSGFLGVNTSNPQYQLDVTDATVSSVARIQVTSQAFANNLILENVGNGAVDRGTGILFKGPGSSSAVDYGQIKSANIGSGTNAYMSFLVGTSGTLGEKMRIENDGDVGIASSTTNFDLAVGNSGMNSGDTTFTNTSHSSFKENITPFVFPSDYLSRFFDVKVKNFKYKDDYAAENNLDTKMRVGLMADEVNPLVGYSEERTTLSGDDKMNAMWEAIRQLIDKVFDLFDRQDAQEQRIDQLEKEVQELKELLTIRKTK